MQNKSVCIIPARGGSKRIPRKNIKLFHGKPLIAYSIEVALKSNLFEKVIVSTDDEEIAKVAIKYGAVVPFIRPKELSDDFTGTGAVIEHTINYLKEQGEKYDFICTIYATAPFLDEKYLIEGFEKLQNSNVKMAFSCTSMPFPIQRTFKITNDERCEMFWKENFMKRSQDLEEAYQDAGQFYWDNQKIKSDEIAFGKDSIPIILPRYLVQDIDTLEDWTRAEFMYQAIFQDEFDKWTKLKKELHNKKEIIKFSQGNIYFMSIGKNIGYEIYGKKESFLRPVLVYKKLSNETFLGIPLSSKQKIGNYYFTFQYSDKTSSTALLNQMKIFDIRRSAYYDGYINVKDFAKLREQVKEFVDITPNRKGKGNGHASKKLPKDSKILSKKDKDVK